jgi:hypothetical protein
MEIFVGIALVLILLCGTAKGRSRLERDDLERVRRLSDKIHREEVLPFE